MREGGCGAPVAVGYADYRRGRSDVSRGDLGGTSDSYALFPLKSEPPKRKRRSAGFLPLTCGLLFSHQVPQEHLFV